MWVIFDEVKDGARLVYPDERENFTDANTAKVPGKVVAFYTGDLELTPYVEEVTEDPRPLLTITGVTGADYVSTDYSYFEAQENAEVTFTGTLSVPDSDRPFPMPIVRKDTGRIIYASVSVTGGILTATVRFPVSGKWNTNENLVNADRAPGEHLRFMGITGVVFV